MRPRREIMRPRSTNVWDRRTTCCGSGNGHDMWLVAKVKEAGKTIISKWRFRGYLPEPAGAPNLALARISRIFFSNLGERWFHRKFYAIWARFRLSNDQRQTLTRRQCEHVRPNLHTYDAVTSPGGYHEPIFYDGRCDGLKPLATPDQRAYL